MSEINNSKNFEINHAINSVNWLYVKGFINRREYGTIRHRLNAEQKQLESEAIIDYKGEDENAKND